MISQASHGLHTQRVIYRSREEAEKKTGYFVVSAIKITAELCQRVSSFIYAEKLHTYSRQNNRKTSWNLYTLKFTLRIYSHTPTKYGWLTCQGAMGGLKYGLQTFAFRKEGERVLIPPSKQTVQEYEDQLKRTPEFDQMYFWICRKYPDDILSVKYFTEPPQSGIARAVYELERERRSKKP